MVGSMRSLLRVLLLNLSLLMAARCAVTAGFCAAAETPPSLSLHWDVLLPGTAVRGLSEKPAHFSSVEPRIYIGNTACVSPPNCLVFNFSDWSAGKSRGYPEIALSPSTNAAVFSLCFRKESGSVSGELRGYYSRPGETHNGVKRSWPFLWLTFDDLFSVKAEGRQRWQTVRVGAVLPHVWHRATIAIPPPGETNAVARATLERLGPDGAYATVGSADIPFGELTLKRATSFDLTGSGPCKFFLDDLSWTPGP